MSIGFASFKHLKLPISTNLHDSYITKFDFMKYMYAFATVEIDNNHLNNLEEWFCKGHFSQVLIKSVKQFHYDTIFFF